MRRCLPFITAVLLSAQFLAFPAAAQVPDAGARVRATMRAGSFRYVGHFGSLTADTLTIATIKAGASPQRLLLSSLRSLEVSRGRSPSRGALGMVVGGVVGAAAGALIGYTAGNDYESEKEVAMAFGAGAGALVGAVGGYFIGAHERWRQVNLDELGRR